MASDAIIDGGDPGLKIGSLKENTVTEILLEMEVDGVVPDSASSFRIEIEKAADADSGGEAA